MDTVHSWGSSPIAPVLAAVLATAALLAALKWYSRGLPIVDAGQENKVSTSKEQAPTVVQAVVDRGSGWLKVAPDGRRWGHWIPSDFRMPHISPRLDFDIKKTKPPLYRAFKYKHTVTMDAKATMPWDDWIELDNEFPRYHRMRVERVKERGNKIFGTMPGAETAVQELVLELAEYLVARYPMVYSVERRPSAQGSFFGEANEIRKISIDPLGASYDLDEDDPMLVAGLISPVDIAVMIEGEDSLYYMKGGMIALPGTWRYEDKIGLDLYAIHTTGNVPEYKTKLDLPMTRFHQRLRPENPGWRNNYSLVVDTGEDELAWETSTKGPEDVYDHKTKGPHPSSSVAKDFKPCAAPTDPTNVLIRQERQTLRRLPRTGAVIFTIHSYTESITAIASEPGVPGRLASSIGSWKGEVNVHRDGDIYKKLLIPYLSGIHAQHVAAGLTPEGQDSEWKYPY